METNKESVQQSNKPRKAPINQSIEYIVERERAKWHEIEIRTQVEKNLRATKPEPNKKHKSNQLQTNLTDPQRDKLFDLLVLHGFIATTTDKEGFIWAFGGVNDNYTSYSTKWLKNDNLAVYLVDCLCYDKNVKIQDSYLNRAGKIFGIKNPRQSKKGYENNKNGTPDGYEIIETIISEAQKKCLF